MDTLFGSFVEFCYPVSLLLFSIGSGVQWKKDRCFLSAGVLIGFLLTLIGYLLQNYGPSDTRYTEEGAALIKFTWLFPVGYYAVFLGMSLASVCYLLRVKKHAD